MVDSLGFVLPMVYRCNKDGCRKQCQSTTPEVLDQLPDFVRRELAMEFTHKGILHKPLHTLMIALVGEHLSFEAFHNVYKQVVCTRCETLVQAM